MPVSQLNVAAEDLVSGERITTRTGAQEIIRSTFVNDAGLIVVQLANGADEVYEPQEEVLTHRPPADALSRWT